MIAVLNNIRSLHNVGSIFRTSDAAGVEKIYLCGYTPQPFNEFGIAHSHLAKTALGAENTVSWEKRKSAVHLIDRLKADGYKIYAVELGKNSVRADRFHLSKKELARAVFVVGNEVTGLSRAILSRADCLLEIPMRGMKESLNVSVAFGVVVYCASARI
jgi:tRNA G18 (ribose-2'-O)-methylase SpoU